MKKIVRAHICITEDQKRALTNIADSCDKTFSQVCREVLNFGMGDALEFANAQASSWTPENPI